ncbi:hypothetical protein M0805_006460 [Coniferiporia weirii]|nr:hypothetical protein M0805_006460 [Coniferiporia weirii]
MSRGSVSALEPESPKPQNAQETEDIFLGPTRSVYIDNFEDHYLRTSKTIRRKGWKSFRNDSVRKFSEEMMSHYFVVKLLTKISLFACEDENRCLAFYDTRFRVCLEDFSGSKVQPDVVAKWTSRENAQKIAEGGHAETSVCWHEIQSLVEVKRELSDAPLSKDTGKYLHVLPRGIPSLAGMLYLAWDTCAFRLYWSDTSGAFRSRRYEMSHEDSWDVLLRYTHTAASPLVKLPVRDPSMSINLDVSEKPMWDINCSKASFRASLICATETHSRQTCVFWDDTQKRIIKDQWCDIREKFSESKILEKVKGVPGVVQVDFSEVVKGPGGRQDLGTSKLHSGSDRVLPFSAHRRIPRRTKQRFVLKTKGDPLSKRRSVLQILMAIYDSIQAHQTCVNERRVLHCDISRNNILINPVHYDAEPDDESKAKCINQILNPAMADVKEEGVLIDWDRAVDLDGEDADDALTWLTGTPMFVAISVGCGEIRHWKRLRESNFPTLEGEAKQLYIRAFGQEVHDRYITAINESPRYISDTSEEKEPSYKHAPYHDAESFFWVLVYELLVAWPECEEDELSMGASYLMFELHKHDFMNEFSDIRKVLRLSDLDYWEKILHPRLLCLAETICELGSYFNTEWAYWKDLPEDHAHEALKRLLLPAILKLKADPIPLREEERTPRWHMERKPSYRYEPGSYSRSASNMKRKYPSDFMTREEPPHKRRKVDNSGQTSDTLCS